MKGEMMAETVVNNTINKTGIAIELDPEKRYCIEVPWRLSDADIARINYQWKELMEGKHPLLVLDGGAKIARIKDPDDPDHNPDA